MSERGTIAVPVSALLRDGDGDGAARGGRLGRIHLTHAQTTGMPTA